MTQVLRLAVLGLCSFVLAATSALAAGVQYTLTNLGGDQWRYDFTLVNTPAAPSFDEFTIYFDSVNYSAIALQSTSPGWDSFVIQPDSGIPADGYLDGLRLAGAMPGGTTAPGFAVTFTYAAGLKPGAQSFDLIDSSNFTVVESGRSTPAVPEPQSWILLGLGGILLTQLRQKPASSTGLTSTH